MPKATTRATAGAAAPLTRDIVGIHVKFTLNTPDGLRRVIFELRKEVDDTTVKWTINFQLFERAKKNGPFQRCLGGFGSRSRFQAE